MRLKPGVVRDAIKAVLREKGIDGAKVQEIHAGVVERVGHDVPPSSVRSYLNLNTPGLFQRLEYGTYRLAHA